MTPALAATALIGLDWGTTSCRAYAIDAAGGVIARVEAPLGIRQITDGAFADALDGLIAAWPIAAPVLASGMITSRQGWVETPYLPTPVDAAGCAAALMRRDTPNGRPLWFAPGVRAEAASGAPDVMRGEETQALGAAALGARDGLVALPGTHSKWVTLEAGRLTSLATYMTGELYAALRQHTILGALMAESPFSEPGFDLGVARGLADGASLSRILFEARTRPLFGRIGAEDAADFLSGLLIGAEVADALGRAQVGAAITVLGAPDLAARYVRALRAAGREAAPGPADVAAAGHVAIARAAGLLPAAARG